MQGEIILIDVRRFPGLGREVAARTGVRHELPQVIVLRDGVAVWAADHRDIAVAEIEEALRLFPWAPLCVPDRVDGSSCDAWHPVCGGCRWRR